MSYNVTTNFYPSNEDWESVKLPIAASVAIAAGAAVGIEISSNDTTGNITLMGTENAAGADFKGILQEAVAATDDDYATAGKLKLVLIPKNENAKAYFTATSGTLTLAMVGRTVEFASTSLGLDESTLGKGARIVGFTSLTRGVCSFDIPNTETA